LRKLERSGDRKVRNARPSLKLAEKEAKRAAFRSSAYSFFAKALDFPGEEFYAAAADKTLERTLQELANGLPFEFHLPASLGLDSREYKDLQAQYIAFFEVGPGKPPCPLYEGAFRKNLGRKSVMEELLRFYTHFGLKMSERVRELPDHLTAELEFMHYLTFLEAGENESRSQNRRGLLIAQRDFLARHLVAWTPALAQRARDRQGPRLYTDILSVLESYVNRDHAYVENELSRQEVPR